MEATASDQVAVEFAVFYGREFRSVVALGYALTGSWASAEDLAQEAFLAAHRRWSTIGRYERPEAWVRRAVSNRSVSLIRRRVSEVRARARLGNERGPALEAMPSEEEAFWEAVRALPKRQRQVVSLYYVDGYRVAEIADVLRVAEATVKTHMRRGRASLAAALGVNDGGSDEPG